MKNLRQFKGTKKEWIGQIIYDNHDFDIVTNVTKNKVFCENRIYMKLTGLESGHDPSGNERVKRIAKVCTPEEKTKISLLRKINNDSYNLRVYFSSDHREIMKNFYSIEDLEKVSNCLSNTLNTFVQATQNIYRKGGKTND